MANQPKKYKKFVATAATATLVASAIVPVASAAASFPDVAENNSHAEAINALVEAGIIKGYEDGTFKPNAQLTRGHVVKMLGKWVEAQGFKIPADYNTVQRFDDVAVDAADQELVKYAALVKDTGVFLGSDGDLNAAASITRENMALTLDRAYKAVYKKSLVELAAGSTNLTVSDLASAKEEAREEIQALRNLGISNVNTFNPKDTVTRAQFASFLYRTIEAQGTPSTEVSAIKSLTATKVNELTVVFDAPVADTEAAKFTVARGTTNITVSDVKWNEDKTQAVLTVDTKFTDGTYNVTVSGVASKDLTASVTTTREAVSSIEFNSDYLVFTGKKGTVAGKPSLEAKIGFTIYNQYGEDITDNVNHQNFKSVKIKGIDENDIYVDDLKGGREGVITVWVDEDEDDDATGTISLSYEEGKDIEIDVDHDVTLSDESEPGSVEILDIYNDSEEEFTTANVKDKHDFYILFNVTDQYGVKLNAEDYEDGADLDSNLQPTSADALQIGFIRDGLRIDVSNKDIFEIDDEDQITVLDIDGKHYFAVPLTFDLDDVVGGENTVTFRSKATGEENSKAFNLVGSSEVDKIEIGTPDELVAADEKVLLPVFAYDQSGELITDAADLNDKLRSKDGRDPEIKISWDGPRVVGSTQTNAFNFIEKDGQVYLQFKTTDHDKDEAEDLEIEIEVDASGEESSIELSVYAKAYAKSIVGINTNTYVYKDGTRKVKLKDLKIEDQYGRTFDDVENYTITATSKDNSKFTIDGNNTFKKPGDEIVVKGTGSDGSATVEFFLDSDYTEKGVDKKATDKYSVTFRSVDEDDFKSYVVESDGTLYGEVATKDTANIEVFGVTSNGSKVKLPTSAYSITAVSGGKYLTITSSDVATTQAAVEKLQESGVTSIATEIAVTINKDGQRVTHALTISEDDPAVKSFNVKDRESASEKSVESFDLVIGDSVSTITTTNILDALLIEGEWDLEDQYGEDVTVSGTTATFFDGSTDQLKLRISNVNAANDTKYTISDNGTSNTSINVGSSNGVNKGDSFTLTITIDGSEQSYKVYVK